MRFNIDKKKVITFLLIAFITFVFWFSPANALSVTVVAPNGGETWLQGTTKTILFNIINNDEANDSNANIYYSKTVGLRENIIITDLNLTKTKWIDQLNSNTDWNGTVGGNPNSDLLTYTGSTKKQGTNSLMVVMNTTQTNAQIKKQFQPFDLNEFANGKIHFWWYKDPVGIVPASNLTIYLYEDGSDSVYSFWQQYGIATMPNGWNDLIWDMNTAGGNVGGADYKGIWKVQFNFSIDWNGTYYLDDLRVYNPSNVCPAYYGNDGNTLASISCSYSWTLPASGDLNNLYVDVNISNGTTTVQDSSNTAFNFQGFRFRFWDEKTGLSLTPDSFTIDNNSWFSYCGTGSCTVPNTTNLTAAYYTVSVDKSGYGTRNFYYYIDLNLNIDQNVALLTTDVNSTSRDFEFYDTTGTSLLSGRIMKAYDINHMAQNFLVGSQLSTGTASFFLDNNAARYTIKAFNTSGGIETAYADYNVVSYTIKKPLDEADFTTSISNFSVKIIGNSGWDRTNLTTDTVFSLFGNTALNYTFTVGDNNTDYYYRDYVDLVKGNATTATLQPYLAKISRTSPIVLIVTDTELNPLAGVKIILSKQINGAKTTMASGYTDIAGNFPTYVEYGTIYGRDVYYPEGTLRESTTDFKPVSNPEYIRIGLATIDNPPDYNKSSIVFTPPYYYLYGGTHTLTQIVSNTRPMSRINIKLDQNSNGIYYLLYDMNFWWVQSLNNDINADKNATGHPDYNSTYPFSVCVTMYRTDNNLAYATATCHEYKAPDTNALNFLDRLKDLRTDPTAFNCAETGVCFGTSILSIILTVLLTGGLVLSFLRVDATGISIIGLGILGFFVLIQWFDILLYVPIAIIALLLMRGDF